VGASCARQQNLTGKVKMKIENIFEDMDRQLETLLKNISDQDKRMSELNNKMLELNAELGRNLDNLEKGLRSLSGGTNA
jgi:peptidoglycan hydrolase CwlO-like protein